MNQFKFNAINRDNSSEIASVLSKLCKTSIPIIICVGSDLVVGDSLGPIVGEELNKKLSGKTYVYGTLKHPITAKEAAIISKEIKFLHPKSQILVVDAAVGDEEDIGLIKITDKGIKPGLGVNKNLPEIGSVSIIGIVAAKSDYHIDLEGKTRLNLVYEMKRNIVEGITRAIC